MASLRLRPAVRLVRRRQAPLLRALLRQGPRRPRRLRVVARRLRRRVGVVRPRRLHLQAVVVERLRLRRLRVVVVRRLRPRVVVARLRRRLLRARLPVAASNLATHAHSTVRQWTISPSTLRRETIPRRVLGLTLIPAAGINLPPAATLPQAARMVVTFRPTPAPGPSRAAVDHRRGLLPWPVRHRHRLDHLRSAPAFGPRERGQRDHAP